jgi:hypothetical protein
MCLSIRHLACWTSYPRSSCLILSTASTSSLYPEPQAESTVAQLACDHQASERIRELELLINKLQAEVRKMHRASAMRDADRGVGSHFANDIRVNRCRATSWFSFSVAEADSPEPSLDEAQHIRGLVTSRFGIFLSADTGLVSQRIRDLATSRYEISLPC